MNSFQPYILLVDDDEDDRYLMQLAFKEAELGYHLKMHSSPFDTVKFLESLTYLNFPSLIVVDYNMPQMNGAELLRYLKQHEEYKAIPVALYSTGMNLLLQEQLLRMGAHSCFIKPFSPAELSHFVSYIRQLLSNPEIIDH